MTALRHPAVFTIGASANFADCLARGLLERSGGDPLALSSAIIYLPTRRAARGFGEAFAKVMGGAALLPQFRALGDSEEDDLLFDAASEGLELAPAIAPLRRQLLLARLIRRFDRDARDGTLSFAQAASLADSLAKVMGRSGTARRGPFRPERHPARRNGAALGRRHAFSRHPARSLAGDSG